MAKNKLTNDSNQEDSEIKEALVAINRVAKVVKGGRRFGFAALVVVGDKKGRVGFGLGKAKEVAEAKSKALQCARKKMIRVYLKESRTLHHDVIGHSGAGKVILRSAKPGTGIIAGGPMRQIFDLLGIHDIVAKSTGSSNVYNVVGATMDALTNSVSPRVIAEKRGKKIGEIIERRETTPLTKG